MTVKLKCSQLKKQGKPKASHVDTWPASVVFSLTFLFCFLLVSLWFLDKRLSWKKETGCIWKHSVYIPDWCTLNLLQLLNNLFTSIVMIHLGTSGNIHVILFAQWHQNYSLVKNLSWILVLKDPMGERR